MQLKNNELWLVTGSQHLYGQDILKEVASHSEVISKHLNVSNNIAVTIVFKAMVTTQDEISKFF